MDKVAKFFNEVAPQWDKMEDRDTSFVLSLLKQLDIKNGDRILDVACGTGIITGMLHELSDENVVGIDISSKMIEIAKEKYRGKTWAKFINDDLFNYTSQEKYDYLVIYNAYPHFLDVNALVNKAYSLLKDNGRLAIVHSLSREALSKHHQGRVSSISRNLESPINEFNYFKNKFSLIKGYENDNCYEVIMKKIVQ